MSLNAFFRFEYVGTADTGVGAIAFANGKVAGLDVGRVVYKGSYEVRDGYVFAHLVMSAPQGARLVTGAPFPAGTSLPLDVEIPLDGADAHVIEIPLPTGMVKVRITKVGDL